MAVIYSGDGASDCKPASVTNQPFVDSTKTNVTACPSVDNNALSLEPAILSEPFKFNVTPFVSKVFA